MKNLKYAEKRIESLKSEMGEVKRVFQFKQGLFIGLENGMILQLHDEEINYQATEYLKSEIEQLKEKHEAIRTALMDNNCEEYGDCIIDEICEAVGILPTAIYYIEGE